MSELRVSYCDYDRGLQLAADGAKPMRVDEILALMDEVLQSSGSFISVVDSEDNLMNFIVEEDGALQLDFPSPDERGSYFKRSSMDECKDALRRSNGKLSRTLVDGLDFERW
jgi:hypothetical protein